jgi:type I restriction enzyme S subunit
MADVDSSPDGFKQTEIGLIPEEWDISTLGTFQDSGLLRIQNGFPCGDHNLEGKGVGHLRPMNVSEAGRIDLRIVKYIQTKIDLSSYFIKQGDIIFNNTNSEELVGKTALYQGENDKYVLSNHMTYMRLLRDDVDRYYLATYLHKRWFDGYYQSICRRHVNQASIGKERIRSIIVPLPLLPEQRAIAHVLSKIQAATQTQAAIAERARELKRALMAKLFTEGLRGEPLKETEIGLMPESWEVVKLDDVFEFLQYGTSERCDVDTGGIPVLRIPNVVEGKIDIGDLKFLKTSGKTVDNLRLAIGDLLFVRTNGRREYTGRCAVFKGELQEALFASYLIRARLNPETILPDFLQLYTETEEGRGQLSGRASGAADGKFNINTQIIRAVVIPRTTLDEQREIIHILQTVDAKITAAERKRAGLDELFRAMLKELMTGRVRVKGIIT